MRMYLKKNDQLTSSLTENSGVYRLAGAYVADLDGCPYIDIIEDFDLLKTLESLPELLLKATKIGGVRYDAGREHGVYSFGKARAKLYSKEKDYYYLEVETSSWEGIADMKILQEKIRTGTILPDVSYENKQVKSHLLSTLAKILDSRNLNKVQRFFLALRLTSREK